MQQPKQSMVQAANDDDDRSAFWSEVQDIATRGTGQPETLTHREISYICQVALIGMMARAAKQEGTDPPASAVSVQIPTKPAGYSDFKPASIPT